MLESRVLLLVVHMWTTFLKRKSLVLERNELGDKFFGRFLFKVI
jgi:hypothetical protein